MSCFKKYGPGEVFVDREETFNNAVNIVNKCFAHSASIGALNREVIDNTALRTDRGTNQSFGGAQSELTWELVITLKDYSQILGNDAISNLFWGAGKDNEEYFHANSICGRSLQIVRQDRDGLLLEILNGCIVQNVVYSCSLSDKCTITFSGVAATKIELTAPQSNVVLPGTMDSVIVEEGCRNTYILLDLAFPASDHLPSNINIIFIDGDGTTYTGQVTEISEKNYTCGFDSSFARDINIESTKFNISGSAGNDNYISSANWDCIARINNINFKLPAQSLEITIETGLSFGELTAGNAFPSEILSANMNVTGSTTVYLDDFALNLMNTDTCKIQIKNNINNNIILTLPNCKITTKPAYELATDSAASGDFEFTAFCNPQFFDLVNFA